MIESEFDALPALFFANESLEDVLSDLFWKCAYLPNHFDAELHDNFHNSFVICKEIIDFLSTNIFENNPNNQFIEILRKNFLHFFCLESDSELSEKSLDFKTFNQIFKESINQFELIKNKEISAKRNSYFCERKLQNLKYSVSCYENLSSIHNKRLDDNLKFKNSYEFAKIRLSNKSLSLSDNELNQSSEFELLGKNLKLDLNRTKNELADFKSENFKLRDQIEILRDQLRQAEDTNCQITTELESQNQVIFEYNKKNSEFQSKILFYEKDIDDLRINNDILKNQLGNFTELNINLNQKLEESLLLINEKDKQLAKVLQESQDKIYEFELYVDEQKKMNENLNLVNAQLDKKNSDLESKVSHFEETISKLFWSSKDMKVEVDLLREKCLILENEMKNLNLKLAKKKSDKNKENVYCDNFENLPNNKVTNSKKSKSKKCFSQTAENNKENVDSSLATNSLPNLNSFLLEQIETNLLNKEPKSSDFEKLLNYVEEILKYIDLVKKQHDETFCSEDVLRVRDTNNNKTPESKKPLSLKEQLFNFFILKDHKTMRTNFHKFIEQSKNHFKICQSLSIENSVQSSESIEKKFSHNNNKVENEVEFGDNNLDDEKNEKFASSSFGLSQSDQIEYFLVSSPTEKPMFKALNSTKNYESQIFELHQDLTQADTIFSKDNSIREKKIHNFNNVEKNLTNIQILPDLINSRFRKSVFDCSYLESELNKDENSKFSKLKKCLKNFLLSNYQKLSLKTRKEPIKFLKTTLSILILGFSVLFFLIVICRDDVLIRQIIRVLSNFFEIKNPFDSIRAS